MNSIICSAIREKKLIRLNYDSFNRIIEPHTYGINDDGIELLRAYQIGGGSESNEHEGWKLFRLIDTHSLITLEQHFQFARPGYKRHDKAMTRQIYCEI